MRLGAQFAAGVVVGVVIMQIGHALYLRNADYIFAAVVTVTLGMPAFAMCGDD